MGKNSLCAGYVAPTWNKPTEEINEIKNNAPCECHAFFDQYDDCTVPEGMVEVPEILHACGADGPGMVNSCEKGGRRLKGRSPGMESPKWGGGPRAVGPELSAGMGDPGKEGKYGGK